MRSLLFSLCITVTAGLSVAPLYSSVIQFSSVAGSNPREAFKQHVLNRTRPIVVKFSATRCPCSGGKVSSNHSTSVIQHAKSASNPVVQKPKSPGTGDKKLADLARAFPTVTFIELNSAAYQEIAASQGVKLEMPTLVYYKNGKAVHRDSYSIMGLEALKESIRTHLMRSIA